MFAMTALRKVLWFLPLSWLFLTAPVRAAEWVVHAGDALAATVAKAAPHDTVIVERGDYTVHLLIDKPLTLRGRNRPTLSGGNTGTVIHVTATDVVVEGLIIRDSGADLTTQDAGLTIEPGAHRAVVRGNDFAYDLFGLWIQGVKDVQVIGNLITGKRDLLSSQRGNGIQLYNTTGARIIDNHISYTRDGIYVDVSNHALFRGNRMHDLRYGTHYMTSYYNVWEYNDSYHNRSGLALMEVRNQVVRHNRAWGNTDHGIMLRSIQDAVVEDNVVAGNGKGFFIYDAEHNVIRHNLIIDNRIGVHLWGGSIHNQVDGNDFINNQDQIRYVAAHDEPWGEREGNYWSNYVGWDRDGDGAGDIVYAANDVVDRLTWQYPVVKLMLASPAMQSLRVIAQQFPLLRSPSIVDKHPRMHPLHPDWRRWLATERH